MDQILSLHYGGVHYQPVPDRDGGDGGIDGFCRSDGSVFQFYAPEEPLSTEDLREAIRRKITTDIRKFILNRKRLGGMLGGKFARRWILAVPRVESASLLEHCTNKAGEVRKAALDYVHPDEFTVGIVTDRDFPDARARLDVLGYRPVNLSVAKADVQQPSDWTPSAPKLVLSLRRKVACIPDWSATRRQRFEARMVENYLYGQAYLDKLKLEYPSIHDVVLSTKAARELVVKTTSLMSDESSTALLAGVQSRHSSDLKSGISALTDADAELLGLEAVADWLLRCPLELDPDYEEE